MDFNKPINLKFQIKCQETKWGESLCLLGENESLGTWNNKKAVKMSTDKNTFPMWFSQTINLIPKKSSLEYKYLIVNEHGIVKWEDFPNNRIINFNELKINISNEEISEIEVKDVNFGKNPMLNNSVNSKSIKLIQTIFSF